jgi:hypothetical protein
MRDPTATEIEAGILLFAWACGFAWFVMRLLFSVLGS